MKFALLVEPSASACHGTLISVFVTMMLRETRDDSDFIPKCSDTFQRVGSF
jgi:hypothetical protein